MISGSEQEKKFPQNSHESKPLKKATSVTGELTQWLGVLSALPEDLDLDASTYVVVHNSLYL